MARTYQVNVSKKKGVVVSNHEGSQPFSLVAQAARYMAEESFLQYGEESVIAKVTVHGDYPKYQALLDWFRANPTSMIVIDERKLQDVAVRWLVKY